MLPANRERRKFRTDREKLRLHARDLYKLRRRLPPDTRRFASNIIEQIYNIETEADLERLRPYMEFQRQRLEEALRTINRKLGASDG